jgi:NADH:ubiquinone oxidoreductase subunit H
MAGWSSNSKYAFLGGVRSAAQMISYEIPMSVTILSLIVISGSLNFLNVIQNQNFI